MTDPEPSGGHINYSRREDMTTPGHQDLDGAVVTLTEQGDNTI
jgi:hypothetical protein